jgi:integrase
MSIRKREWKTADGEVKSIWIVDFRHNGKRHIRSFEKKADAVAADARVKEQKRQGLFSADGKMTIAAVLEAWLADNRAEGLERSTIEQRAQYARDYINPHIGSVKVSQLTTPQVNALADKLRDTTQLAPSTRQKVLVSLRTALAFAKGRGWVAQNVAADRKRRTTDRHTSIKLKAGEHFPTKAELSKIIEAAPPRWRAFFIVAIFCGMRASELRGLRWEDVDLDRGLIHVRQRADHWGVIGSPKSKAGTRDIPCVPMVTNALKQWKLATAAPGHELVFCSSTGKPHAMSNVNRLAWKPLLQRTGLPPYNFHSLRHAAASLFIELGWAPKRIQDLLGHSSIVMTMDRYGHLFPANDLAGDLQRLQAAVIAA